MNKLIIYFFSITLSVPLYADPLEFIGTTPQAISVTNNTSLSVSSQTKVIYLQQIRLSPEAQTILRERLTNFNYANTNYLAVAPLPKKVDLGMNNTPVLDQGAHGSCVTFAATGAINAVIGKGNYVSQLCSLELGSYLVKLGTIPYSGWDGSYAKLVLNQLQNYGIVSIAYQQQYGCAGVKQYPTYEPQNRGKPMSIALYTASSLLPSSTLARWSWGAVISPNEVYSRNYNAEAALVKVKTLLSQGKRITFGILLDETKGQAGAVGKYVKSYDTWVLTNAIAAAAKKPGGLRSGHEMIIVGYDDNAVVKTATGETNKGLFIVRNSWGPQAGNQGTYYVSYQYFKAFCDEAAYISK
jgi:C1A family cysteine protease